MFENKNTWFILFQWVAIINKNDEWKIQTIIRRFSEKIGLINISQNLQENVRFFKLN